MKIESIYKYMFVLLLPSLIVSKAANSIILAFLVIYSIFFVKNKYHQLFFKKYLLFSSFLFSIFIGLTIDLFTQNGFEFREIIKRASFIFIPFILYSSKKHLQLLSLKVFIYFLSLLSLLLIFAGIIRSIINRGVIIYGIWDSKTTEEFYSHDMLLNWGELSYKRLFLYFDMHPTYYAIFSLIVILLIFFTNVLNLSKKRQLAIVIVHVIMIVMVSSKAGILSLFLVLLIKLFTDFNKKYLIIITSSLAILMFFIFIIPSTQLRVKRAIESISSKKTDLKNSSTNERIILWKSINGLNPKELIFGIGHNQGRKRIFSLTGIDKNMHNQYLQTLVSSGILGFILIIFFLFLPLIYQHNLFVKTFIFIIIFNLLFENMFDRIWGIMIISFFYSIFIFGKINLKQISVLNSSKK